MSFLFVGCASKHILKGIVSRCKTLVLACDDAKIRIWTIPDSGIDGTLTEPSLYLKGSFTGCICWIQSIWENWDNIWINVGYSRCVRYGTSLPLVVFVKRINWIYCSCVWELDWVVWMLMAGHTEKIYSIKFHPLASGVIASASYDKTVRIWDVDAGEERITLQGHEDTVLLICCHFSSIFFAVFHRFCFIKNGLSMNRSINQD